MVKRNDHTAGNDTGRSRAEDQQVAHANLPAVGTSLAIITGSVYPKLAPS